MRTTAILFVVGLVACGGSSSTSNADLAKTISNNPDLTTTSADFATGSDFSTIVDLSGTDTAVAVDMTKAPDMAAGGPMLTVDNTKSWCQVTVTVGTASPVVFETASMSFAVTASESVTLNAIPIPKSTFEPVKWTGVTTMNGANATYTATSAATQTVTACCALSNGTGC